MDIVKIIAIMSVFIKTIEMIPIATQQNLSNKTVLKLPKHINSGTKITILGYYSDNSIFSATFSGEHMDEQDQCKILFELNEEKSQINILLKNQNMGTTYYFPPEYMKGSLLLYGHARNYGLRDQINLYFEEEYIGVCPFSSFKSLEHIVFEGVEHVKNLNFSFT